MAVARFVPVPGIMHGAIPSPAWPGGSEPLAGTVARDGSWVAWRLLGANNRELGRSALVFPDLARCAESVRSLRTQLAVAATTVVVDLNSGLWVWHLSQLGERVALSGRRYSRQRECRYSLEQFATLAPTAMSDFALPRMSTPVESVAVLPVEESATLSGEVSL